MVLQWGALHVGKEHKAYSSVTDINRDSSRIIIARNEAYGAVQTI